MKTLVNVGITLTLAAGSVYADSLAIVAADSALNEGAAQQALIATGKFSNVTLIDTQTSTPDLPTLSGFTDILVWTVAAPFDRVALGDVLANFYDLPGKHLTIATYAFSQVQGTSGIFVLPDPELKGRIVTGSNAMGSYAAFNNVNVNGNVSGTLMLTAPTDPIFSGIDPTAIHYAVNQYMAHPTLAAGATLLATDGSPTPIPMIARSQNGVVDINFYPGGTFDDLPGDNNQALFNLIANTFTPPQAPVPVAPTANPGGPYSFCPQSKPWLLDGTHSVDPELGQSQAGNPPETDQYGWDFTGAAKFTDASGAQPDVTAFFTNLGPGIYPAALRVTASTAASFPASGLANLTGTASTQVLIKNSCTCITSLTASATPTGKIQLTWPLTGSNHYNVYRVTASGGPYSLLGSTSSTVSTYLDNGVVSGTTYYYIVREANLLNTETCQSNEAKVTPVADTIPPTTTVTIMPGPNGKGWNNSNVSLTFNATDNPGGSGVKQISVSTTGAQTGSVVIANGGSVTITAAGVTTVTYSGADNAGNVETAKTQTVMIDKTTPTAAATSNPPPDATGSNTTDVTVTFTGADSLSGIASCTAPVTVSTAGSGQKVTGFCTDNAGNASAPATVTVNINKGTSVVTGVPIINGAPAPGKCVLGTPDNKMVEVARLWVKDPSHNLASFEVAGKSNEPPSPGRQDIVIKGSGLEPRLVRLRDQSLSTGNGRIYTITATATDRAGKQSVSTFTCTVPKSQGNQSGESDGDDGGDEGHDEKGDSVH